LDVPLLSVSDLTVAFPTDRGLLVVVDHVSFDVREGRTLCIVGESGCGKSLTAAALLDLVPVPGKILSGRVEYQGRDILALSENDLRQLRGNEISIVFQEPASALNPVLTVGYQVVEVIRAHQGLGRAAARAKAVQVLEMVGMPGASDRLDAYPHELSGGMRQRVMIAVALACRPALLVADEPTTALDVTIQAQILDLLTRLQTDLGMALVLITHDLGVVAETADEVIVMYAGQVVEAAASVSLFSHPRHPYTQALLRSIPSYAMGRLQRLNVIPGGVPGLTTPPSGCRFADRCPVAVEPCRTVDPDLRQFEAGHDVRCHLVKS
jgi:oligopeptide/dipeptide ABC transporter ATP-binding protein